MRQSLGVAAGPVIGDITAGYVDWSTSWVVLVQLTVRLADWRRRLTCHSGGSKVWYVRGRGGDAELVQRDVDALSSRYLLSNEHVHLLVTQWSLHTQLRRSRLNSESSSIKQRILQSQQRSRANQ